MKKFNIVFIVSAGFLILFWYVVTLYSLVEPLFLPSPQEIYSSAKVLFLEKDFFSDIVASITRVLVAFFASVILAVPTALLMANNKLINDLLSPYIDFIRYLPVPTLIPLTILFFGIDETAKIVLLFIGTYFQLVLLILNDIKQMPNEYRDLFFSLNLNKFKKMVLTFRNILPSLYDNARVTLGWCWTYLVIAELVASPSGIGHMIKEAQRFSNTPDVYVGILTMGCIGFLSDYLFKAFYPYLFKYGKVL